MKNYEKVIEKVKNTVHEYLPNAKVLLSGSFARNIESIEIGYYILRITETRLLPGEKLLIRSKLRKSLLFPTKTRLLSTGTLRLK